MNTTPNEQRNIPSLNKRPKRFPGGVEMLFYIIVLTTVLTYLIPAGLFERVEQDGIELVDANSFHFIDRTPVNPFNMFTSIHEGFLQGAEIIFLILFGYFWVYTVIKSGAFGALINKMVNGKAKNSKLFIPICIILWALAGSTYGELETVYGMLPIFIALSIALGYDALVGISISGLAVCVGFASATTNPFTIGIAQSIAGLPLFSGLVLRWIIFVVFVGVTILWTLRYAAKIKADPQKSLLYGMDFSAFSIDTTSEEASKLTGRHIASLIALVLSIVVIVYGTLTWGWYFMELNAIFLITGILISIIAGFSPAQMAENFLKSCQEMMIAAIVVGLARTILVVMQDGNIIDTIIYGLYLPLKTLPSWLCATAMYFMQTLINFFIPSGSGQAAAVMPIMVPVADLLGINRQVAVLAYQFGDGFSNLLWPTGPIIILTGISKVPLNKWYRFFLPLFGVFVVLNIIFIIIANQMNFGPF